MEWKTMRYDRIWVAEQLGIDKYSFKQHSNSIDIYVKNTQWHWRHNLYLPWYLRHKKIKLILDREQTLL